MRKRIALAAAIALAISVGGMVPASAAKLLAPTVTSSSCSRAGGTLDLRVNDGNVFIEVGATALDVESPDGTDFNTATGCTTAGLFDLAGLTAVTIKVDDDTPATLDKGDVTFNLESPVTPETPANYAGIAWSVQAMGTLKFDASGFDLAVRPMSGVVTEETFAVSTLSGSYYAGEAIEFGGGAGADSFDASAVTTTVVKAMGDAGDDVLRGGALGDTLNGEAGADKNFGNAGDDSLTANGESTATADQAWGGAGIDTILADAKDTVAPGDGIDSITLDNGTILLYVDSSAAISVDLDAAPGIVRSTAGDDYYTSNKTPWIVGSELADTLSGGDNGDTFFGGSGADKLLGFGGDDTLSGGGGTDAIKGGEGDDDIEGASGADKLYGGPDDDTIIGGGGDDIMYGSVGDDTLRGKKGSDQAWGGRGTFDVCAAEVTDSCEFKK